VTSIPEYSEDGLGARDIFFAGVARVHIFVEDENLENLYSMLFTRLFPALENYQIFPMAGKSNVVRHARDAEADITGAVRIYVLDKDFDDLMGRLLDLSGVFYLDDFNIETSIIDDVSLLRICVEERPRVKRADLEGRLRSGEAWRDWMPYLDRLHRAFALVQKHDLGIQNTDLAPERFTVDGDPSSFDETRVRAYIDDVSRRLIEKGVLDSPDDYSELSRKVFGNARVHLRHVNGKFLFRLFFHRMKRRQLVSNLTQDSMVMRCVGASELRRLRSFKRRIGDHLKVHNLL